MKTKLFLTAMAVTLSLCGYAQTKGTNALGFGVNYGKAKSEAGNSSQRNTSEQTNQFFSLGYGHFIKDNVKLGLELSYGKNESSHTSTFSDIRHGELDTYGAAVSYHQYYPIIKNLYAYGAGYGGYSFNKQKNSQEEPEYRSNAYSLGAYGGVSWFVSKRFALETTLLNANFRYENTTTEYNAVNSNDLSTKSRANYFNLSSSGLIEGLGFKIYFLF